MRIDVVVGDVLVTRVEVCRHPQNLMTITVRTPLDPHAAVTFGTMSEGEGVAHFVDLWPAGRVAPMSATRVILYPAGASEVEAFSAGLMELDKWARWSVVLLAIPPQVVGRSNLVSAWDRPAAPAEVDYLDRGFEDR